MEWRRFVTYLSNDPRSSSKVVTIASIILSPKIIQNGDILLPAHPGCPGKWPLNKRRRRRRLIDLVLSGKRDVSDNNICVTFYGANRHKDQYEVKWFIPLVELSLEDRLQTPGLLI